MCFVGNVGFMYHSLSQCSLSLGGLKATLDIKTMEQLKLQKIRLSLVKVIYFFIFYFCFSHHGLKLNIT